MENDCTPKCGDLSAPISASSVIYKGNILTCIGAEIPDTLESIVHKLDQAICDKLKDIGSLTELANTGGGIELYLGESNTGKKEIATLRSPDDSVSIVYNSETKEVDIEVDFPQIQSYIFSSDDGSVDITTNEEGNEVDFSINFPDQEFLNLTSTNSSVTITDGLNPNTKNLEVNFELQEFLNITSSDGSIVITDGIVPNTKNLAVNFEPQEFLTLESDDSITITDGSVPNSKRLEVQFPDQQNIPTQVKSNVIERDPGSLAFIQNQNPNKVISENYTLISDDNGRTIVADATNQSITITVPNTNLPTNNYFVGFIQKGIQAVTINGFDIKPEGFQKVIEGQGHNAAVEIVEIQGTRTVFLLGSLKKES